MHHTDSALAIGEKLVVEACINPDPARTATSFNISHKSGSGRQIDSIGRKPLGDNKNRNRANTMGHLDSAQCLVLFVEGPSELRDIQELAQRDRCDVFSSDVDTEFAVQ